VSKRAWLPGLLSGLLLGITTIGHGPFYHVHWAIFFGFVPLWAFWLRGASPKEILLSGWACQFALTLVAFHWIAYTVNEFSHMGLALSVLVMLLYCAVANLQFPLAGLVWHRLFAGAPAGPRIAGLALLTALGERLGTAIFHWNFGYAWLYMRWPGAQLADVAGFRWLCTFSICLNGLLVAAWLKRGSRRAFVPLGAAVAAFLLVNALGAWRLHLLPPPDAKARVLLVQPNVGNREKEKLDKDQDFRPAALEGYFRLTDRALATLSTPPDFAVWPENAFPGYIADTALTFGLTPKLKTYLQARRLNLLTGGYGLTPDGKVANSLFALDRSGTWLAPAYEKRILLPFGEYVPGAETFPALKRWLPDVRDYGRGAGPVVLRLGGFRLGAQICYEGLFDFIARDLANAGAQILVNVTNDSWYGTWMEPWQHFYITMAKAIETRRPLIRDTNTGISAVAFADGSLSELSPVGKEWFQLVEVPYRANPPATIFLRWGYWIDWCFLGLGLAFALALSRRGRWRKATPGSGG
jgi:apolipoprotein N-acyltransferase